MRYLYCILRLFFTPKCKHKWKTVSVKENEVCTKTRWSEGYVVTGNQTVIRYECVFCGITHFKEFRTDV